MLNQPEELEGEKMRVCIDMKRTGKHLKQLIMDAGYNVSDIQKFLELSCPQPVYRWYKGKALPTVDHLLILSILLGKHMEELIVTNIDDIQEFLVFSLTPLRDFRQINILSRT